MREMLPEQNSVIFELSATVASDSESARQGRAEAGASDVEVESSGKRGRVRDLSVERSSTVKVGWCQVGPGEWVSATFCAPGSRASCLSHEQVITVETSPPSHIGTRPAEATHLITPLANKLPRVEAGPPSPGESKWLLKRAHDLMRKHPRSQHGLGWPRLCTPPGHQGNKRSVQTALSHLSKGATRVFPVARHRTSHSTRRSRKM